MALTAIKEDDLVRTMCDDAAADIIYALTDREYNESEDATCFYPHYTGQKLQVYGHDRELWDIYEVKILWGDYDDLCPELSIIASRGENLVQTWDKYDLEPSRLDKICAFIKAVNYEFIPYNKN